MEERVQPAELFELFEENTPESAELNFILDLNDGNKLSGEVNENYFFDSIKRLKIENLTRRIDELKIKAENESEISKKLSIASEIQQLLKQKEKLKSGDYS